MLPGEQTVRQTDVFKFKNSGYLQEVHWLYNPPKHCKQEESHGKHNTE